MQRRNRDHADFSFFLFFLLNVRVGRCSCVSRYGTNFDINLRKCLFVIFDGRRGIIRGEFYVKFHLNGRSSPRLTIHGSYHCAATKHPRNVKSVIVYQRTSSEVHQRCQYQQIVKCIENFQCFSPSPN